MVSEHLGREMWGTPSAAIGKRLWRQFQAAVARVIGVSQDVRENGVPENAPESSTPLVNEQSLWSWPSMRVRVVTFAIRSDAHGLEHFSKRSSSGVVMNSNLRWRLCGLCRKWYGHLAANFVHLVILAIAGAMAKALGIAHLWLDFSHRVATQGKFESVCVGAQRRDCCK